MVLGQDTSQSDSDDQGLELSEGILKIIEAIGFKDGVSDTNYKRPVPFGVRLGNPLDENLILETKGNDKFYINPQIRNKIFDTYLVTTKFNRVISVQARSSYSKKECLLKKNYLLSKLKKKYPEGVSYNSDSWRFIQAKLYEYDNGETEWLYDFEILLSCRPAWLFLSYELYEEKINFEGID